MGALTEIGIQLKCTSGDETDATQAQGLTGLFATRFNRDLKNGGSYDQKLAGKVQVQFLVSIPDQPHPLFFITSYLFLVDIWWFMMIWYEDNWQDSKFIPVTVHIPLTRLRADNPQLQEKLLNTWKSQWFPDVRFPKTSQIAHGFMVLPLSHALWSTEALPQAASRSRRPRIQQLDGFTEHPWKSY